MPTTLPPNPDPVFLSVKATAQALGLSKPTIYVLLNEGVLRSTKIGKRRLVSFDSVQELAAKAA